MTTKKTGRPKGRPRLPAGEHRSVRIMLALTPEEHAEMARLGAVIGLSPAQLMRVIALTEIGTVRALKGGGLTAADALAAASAAARSATSRARSKPATPKPA